MAREIVELEAKPMSEDLEEAAEDEVVVEAKRENLASHEEGYRCTQDCWMCNLSMYYVHGQSVIWPNEMTREAVPIDSPRLDSSVVEYLAYLHLKSPGSITSPAIFSCKRDYSTIMPTTNIEARGRYFGKVSAS
jgi:hypothetical protein